MNRRFFLDSDETFRAILECAPDAMIITDAEGIMLIVNAEAERLFEHHDSCHPRYALWPERTRRISPGTPSHGNV